jgi:hypothetical protein
MKPVALRASASPPVNADVLEVGTQGLQSRRQQPQDHATLCVEVAKRWIRGSRCGNAEPGLRCAAIAGSNKDMSSATRFFSGPFMAKDIMGLSVLGTTVKKRLRK